VRRRAGPIGLDVGDEADKGRIAFEDHLCRLAIYVT
jgi:hypothetical protein